MIDASVGSGTANSYVTLAAAEAYFAGRMDAAAWAAADDATRERALVMAARMLERPRWHGARMTVGQALSWPRTGVPGLVDGTIPPAVIHAQCEEALAWLRPELVRRRLLRSAGVHDARVDGAGETYDAPPPTGLLSADARALVAGLAHLGGVLVTDAEGGAR
jgi:hypothetical protein